MWLVRESVEKVCRKWLGRGNEVARTPPLIRKELFLLFSCVSHVDFINTIPIEVFLSSSCVKIRINKSSADVVKVAFFVGNPVL